MTTPTQAQIEALKFYASDENWIGSEGGTIPAIKDGGTIARAALTAAAEVGDKEWEAVCDSYAKENGQFHAEIERLKSQLEVTEKMRLRQVESIEQLQNQLAAAEVGDELVLSGNNTAQVTYVPLDKAQQAQAQIEVAAKALYEHENGDTWDECAEQDKDIWRRSARVALTAAAEVGESKSADQIIAGHVAEWFRLNKRIEELEAGIEEYACTGTDHPCGCYELYMKDKNITAATIERCAQVADEYVGEKAMEIAAAIRALKERHP